MPPKTLQVSVDQPITLDQVPSGSGMVALDDAIYIISDDSPLLFQLDKEFQIVSQIELTSGYKDVARIEKPLKPDYECLALYQPSSGSFLYGFGSGSLAGKRDSLVVIDLEQGSVKTYNLTSFYDKLEVLTGGESREKLNIEGAVIHEENLYLLNRGTNTLFVVNIGSFERSLNEGKDFADLKLKQIEVELPEKEGEFIGLSGCTLIPHSNKILFTATVEATSNWIDDGEILGSYLGVLDLDHLNEQQQPYLWQFELNGELLKDKIESVTIVSTNGESNYTALAIADNDDGTSKVYPLEIRIE